MENVYDRKASTKRLWDYGLTYISEILSIIARPSTGRPGMEEIKGQTINNSEWLDFLFYDLIWYWNEHKTDMTDYQRLLGHWLGIAHRIRSDLTYLDPDKGRMCDSTIYSATCDNNRIATNNDMRKGTDI
jgi:hypothetical protein